MRPNEVTIAPDGAVHVIGYAAVSPGLLSKWLTRQGTPGTNDSWTWSNTDLFYFALDKSSSGRAITSDPMGNLFAIGSAGRPDGTYPSWLVRRKLVSAP
jgi:hypothetical protein